MMFVLMFTAAGNAPILADTHEAQWRTFVRASLQRPAALPNTRLRQLQGTVRALGDDRVAGEVAGPSGL